MKLSACFIVKNEAKLLPQCLDSIKDYVDEIIVVDTGSTDDTMGIAKSYGAKVYESPWQKDFALHRNQSIDYATGDWFLIIDPDEELAPLNVTKEELKKRFDSLPKDVYGLLVTLKNKDRNGNITSTSQSLRFFRNNVGVKYEGYIHNKAVLPPTGHGVPTDFVMYHYGYDLDVDTMKAKFERSSELLYKRLKDDSEDHEAYYFLCNLLASHERWDEAIQAGEKCLNLLPPDLYFDPKAPFASLYHTVGMIYCARKHFPRRAMRWISNGLWLFPNNIDLHYDMMHVSGIISNGNGLPIYAKKSGERYLELYDFYTKKPHMACCQSFMTMNEEYRGRIEEWLR